MFNPLMLEAPYVGSLETIQKQNPYDVWKGLDQLLDLAREVQWSGNYYWQGIAFPDTNGFPQSNDLVFLPGQTKSGSIQVPSGSYIVALNFAALDSVTLLPGAGIKIKLFDKGTKASIFYGDFAIAQTVMSTMQLRFGAGNDTPDVFGAGYLMAPFIVTDPGVVGWEITSIDNAGNDQVVQVMMSTAVPINKQSIGTRIVEETQ